MSGLRNPYAEYSHRFPEEAGHDWVMAPELLGRGDFEALLSEAVARGTPLSQAEIDSRLGLSVEWHEGIAT